MARRSTKKRNLREACLAEALAIIEREGVEALSLREVARRLGVSHQAPYKHFASRDHILAELVGNAFASFAAHLDRSQGGEEPGRDLTALGSAYLDYAARHPLQYRLMFGTPLPDPAAHPDMMHQARHAFSVLRDTLRRRSGPSEQTDLDALFVWCAVHGVASMMQTNAVATLELPARVLKESPHHSMRRIRAALDATDLPVLAPKPGRRRSAAG